jgi:hypothetical protein
MTDTLNDILAAKASEWTTQDLETIVEGLRSQRERWNAEQAIGSKRLVKSSNIQTKPLQGTLKQAIKGLKL